MTVPTSDNREQYQGNDSATAFDYAFKIFQADDLVVVLTASDGTEATLTRGTDYSVDGVGEEAGGTVTYPLSGDPLATGETLTILREIPVVQETDLRNQGRYYPETLEDEFDRSRMIDQQQQEVLGRTLKKTRGGEHYDAGGARIENLGSAVADGDALTQGQMKAYYAETREILEAAQQAMANAGYEFVGDYASGIELTAYNQVVRDTSGEFWRVSGSTALPYTTTGAGLPEGGAFVTVGDAALRQELAAGVSTGQGALKVSGSVIYVDTIADLQVLPASVGTTIYLTQEGRAGEFVIKDGAPPSDPQKGIYVVLDNGNYAERQYDGPAFVEWWGADNTGATSASLAINQALKVAPLRSVVSAGEGKFKLTEPTIVPVLKNLDCSGRATQFVANFNEWVGTDYRAFVFQNREGVNLEGQEYNAFYGNFSLFSVGADLVEAIALDFRSENSATISGTTVNNAVYNAKVAGIYVQDFDTAVNIYELWATSFSKISCIGCRVGINIQGQAVNAMFSDMQITNFTNSNSSSTGQTTGVYVNGSNRYDGVTKRPEGLIFTSNLIFGAYTNLDLISCLSIKVVDNIIDGGSGPCVRIVDPADLTLGNNYLYTSGESTVVFEALNVAQEHPVKILNNNFVAGPSSINGINAVSGGSSRKFITVDGNHFFNYQETAIYISLGFNYSKITNNSGRYSADNSVQSQAFIRVLSAGDGTLIDGNKATPSVNILYLDPNVSAGMIIGYNKSGLNRTQSQGVAVIPAGSTSVTVDFGFGSFDSYFRPIVTAVQTQNTPMWLVPAVNWFQGRFEIPAALGDDLKIYYQAKAVPFSAV